VRALEEEEGEGTAGLEPDKSGEESGRILDQQPEEHLVCTSVLRHAGGESALVAVVRERGGPARMLASTSEKDAAVRLWQLTDGGRDAKHLHTCKQQARSLSALLSSPVLGGRVLAGGCFPEDVVTVWNSDRVESLRAGEQLEADKSIGVRGRHMEMHALLVLEERRLLTGDDEGTVSKWDVETGAEELRLQEHALAVRSLALLDASTVASGSVDTSIRIWDVRAQRGSAAVLEGQSDAVMSMAGVEAANRLLLSAGERTLKVWDLRMLKMLRELDGKAPAVVCGGSRRQPLLLSSSVDLPHAVLGWELKGWQRKFIINAHSSDVLDLEHEDSLVYSIAPDAIKIWQLAD